MSLPLDLLEQAHFLSQREVGRGRPRQASLRRAVSTAYYAVFHLLSADASSQACPVNPMGLRERVQRSLAHDTMKQAANAIQSNNLPTQMVSLLARPMNAQVISVARGFVRLQEQRHKADYDMSDQFDRTRVLGLVRVAEQIFRDWSAVRNTEDAHIFLAALMFWKLWSK